MTHMLAAVALTVVAFVGSGLFFALEYRGVATQLRVRDRQLLDIKPYAVRHPVDPSWTCSAVTHQQAAPTPHEDEATFISSVPMVMTMNERLLFFRKLRNATHYFEYGAGGSTVMACMVAERYQQPLTIHSVESSKEFLDSLRQKPCLQRYQISHNITLSHVDIGPTGEWGNPSDDSGIHRWHQYSQGIQLAMSHLPDMILVDGRFRIACVLQTILATKDQDSIILVHDFFSRPYYKLVTNYTDVVDCVDSLVVLKKKTDINWQLLINDLVKHSIDFA